MPDITERQMLLREFDLILKMLAMVGQEDEKDFNEIYELKGALEATRYFNLRHHLRKNRSMNDMLWQISEKDFKQWVRMEKPKQII